MNIENNSFKEYKKEIIVSVIILGITYLIDLITGYPFKDLFSNYISAFILFILFSFVLFIFKEKKFIIIIWIVFIISISLHSYYIYITQLSHIVNHKFLYKKASLNPINRHFLI